LAVVAIVQFYLDNESVCFRPQTGIDNNFKDIGDDNDVTSINSEIHRYY